MNNYFRFILFVILVITAIVPMAQTVLVPTPAPVRWISKNSSDEITINNENGFRLVITINVDPPVQISHAGGVNQPGINIRNCGDTRRINAGSSTVCTTRDPTNPVRFSSDSQNYAVTGTYVITQGSSLGR